MDKHLTIEFMKQLPAEAEYTGTEPFKLLKKEKLYPWLSLGKLPWFIPSIPVNLDATIQPGATGFTLTAGYSSKWTTLVGLLTGGIGVALFSGGLHREEYVCCNAKDIKRVVRAVERCKDWPWKNGKDPAGRLTRIVYLVSTESHGSLYAHVFSLETPRHYYAINMTFEQYKEDQAALDKIVHTAVHVDTATPTVSKRKCPACGTSLQTIQIETMIGNSEYQPWCREGFCSLACYEKTGAGQAPDVEKKELI